ncbi:PadR family transcriptional regulator [Salinicoccus halodurans]|uniref:PadR family transcriptional regulator n=1 Tax=Salinicoccus halodurans TaxID=407035 RepID=A0A0F7D500_9STAP|nr:PadR family transcriptional regulator [Salinicoccus halodurans]AKG75120.1 PadR family transcriptional regulator [Salinicoccus halodurans]SFK66044.1 PadR family transcriptional regulator, regulatory protein PadR [Salinicoccus halodurans]
MKSQMLKGILEGCILKLIDRETLYGYDIIIRLQEFNLGMVSEGSIYPLLLKLQKSGYITGRRVKSSEGPMRKYYKITEAGTAYLKEFQMHWEQLDIAVNDIFGEGKDEAARKRI